MGLVTTPHKNDHEIVAQFCEAVKSLIQIYVFEVKARSH
jgi:hypothetical protein